MSGSGVYSGLLWCRMYCVEKNTRNARAFRKSRDVSRPLTGRRVKPVHPCAACYRETQCGAGGTNLQKVRDVAHLRDGIAREAALLAHYRQYVLVLVARMSGHQTHDFVVYNTPRRYLRSGVAVINVVRSEGSRGDMNSKRTPRGAAAPRCDT